MIVNNVHLRWELQSFDTRTIVVLPNVKDNFLPIPYEGSHNF